MKKIDKQGYIRFTEDPSRTAWEHIRVAEKILGRSLGRSEQVHHINGDKTDNTETNIIVLRTNKDHKIIHSDIPYELLKTADGSFVVVKQQRVCPCCNRLFEPPNNRAVFCSTECYRKHAAINIPSPDKLAKQVWEMPATKLAKLYNVSDRTIGKWCTKFGITKPGRGYWAKQQSS